MNKIIFPLKRQMRGENVADLQDGLRLLLEKGIFQLAGHELQTFRQRLHPERSEKTYGSITAKLVGVFQDQQHLPSSGEVDEATAKALNDVLEQLVELPQPDASAQQRVAGGSVRRENGVPASAVLVRAFHEDDRGVLRLGEDVTDADGRYTIRYAMLPGIAGINLSVVAVDADGRPLSKPGMIRDAAALEIVDLHLPDLDRVTYDIAGKVISSGSAAVDKLTIRIVDKTVGEDRQLIDTVTDANGAYRATFDSAVLQRLGKRQPDLQAQAFAGDTFLAASDVRYNASNRETLAIVLDEKTSMGLRSEHQTLTGAIAGHFTGKLGDLQESDARQDITYLANKTGWDARAVALAALADQFSAKTADAGGNGGIAPAFFYALFRAGLPANEDTLYLADAGRLQAIWQSAVEQGVIAQELSADIPATAGKFQHLGTRKLLNRPALTGISSLKEMLAASRLDDARQQQFAALYTAHRDDMQTFWRSVENAFGAAAANRLQVDGKLGFLTINNAPLMQSLHGAAGNEGLGDPLQLAQLGYHRAQKWQALLTAGIPVPKEIPGDTVPAKQANYAAYLAAQVRLSYPTAAVAELVKSGDLAVSAPDQVHDFLMAHQGKFEIGVQPVQQYIKANNLDIAEQTVSQVKRLQRLYQITTDDQAMTGLMARGIDAAYHVARYDKALFVKHFAQDLGGADSAAQTHDKSVQVHNAVLNIAMSYLTTKNGIALGAQPGDDAGGLVLDPSRHNSSSHNPAVANAANLITYPTLEGLFGEMDYCACAHCRSILSPAAYLVDLLLFADHPAPPPGKENPQAVLLERRPDLAHLPLTCENTNTALPYIDVVNETLEYFIANDVQQLSLKAYLGHDTDSATSEDLLASPQFAMDAAYTILHDAHFPAPLPFHRPLESLRRHVDKFDVPLSLAMERLRKNDVLDVNRATVPPPPLADYGWRDILMEHLGLSRPEHDLLTVSNAAPDVLAGLFGFPAGTSDADIIDGNPAADIAMLSNARQFSRRTGISYEELVDILGTRFINPHAGLIPKVERLRVPFAALKALKDGTIADSAFDALLPAGAGALDPADYGGDIAAWVRDDANFDRIMALVILADPTGAADPCNLDRLEFRHAKPVAAGDNSTRLDAVEFVRMLRFIRLRNKTGWTIEQTDAAVCALYRTDMMPLDAADIDTTAKLDAGFLILLPRLGVLMRVMKALNLTAKVHLLPLLACWSPIGTHGGNALYRQMFLNPALLKQDAVFAANGSGEFLADATKKIIDHAEALRSAFNLSADEYQRIIALLRYDANTPLTIPGISAIYRRGVLARALRISVRELLLLCSLSGLDPFSAPDPANPAMLQLVSLIHALKERSIKSATALYLIWNQDLSGKSAPDDAQITELARTLRTDFAGIDEQFAATEDPGGDIARARMTLAYGQEAADAFFALLDDTLVLDTAYTHPAPTLEAPIAAADGNLAYDDFRHRLSHAGLVGATMRDTLKSIAGVPAAFQDAVDALFSRSDDAKGSFFTRYPKLKPLYDTYVAAIAPPAIKRGALLAAFRPALSQRRKRQQALQRLSSAAAVDLAFAQTFLDAATAPHPLHAAGDIGKPALDDVLALETPGLAVQFFFRDSATGTIDLDLPHAANLDYANPGDNPLPANPVAGAVISAIWKGQVETPEAGFYNFIMEADSGAKISLTLDGIDRPLTQNGNLYRNTGPLELKAGTLHDITLAAEKIRDVLKVKWETPKRAREIIPARYLYPPTILAPFSDAFIRFLKTASLAAAMRLSAGEMAYLANHADYRIAGDGWLNALATTDDPDSETAVALLAPLRALLDFARIKAAISPDDDALLRVLQDPATATANADSTLFQITRWDKNSLDDMLAHFGSNHAGLARIEQLRRVYDSFALIRAMGISARALIHATTNEPDGGTVRDLQTALRARYAAADWRDIVQPVNDAMRGLQRDALVAYILHQMRSNPATAHIDTADKLFEYFLMDVQMEPCMQTSRIRHALSSVQLFIERCQMNLEPRISPDAINPQQWAWMKRYRVWEANRKVFLFPENWLEPELRDDKSPFFKEIESELLQSDITDESAATALLNYLTRLEDVAKLEPCGIHHIEADPAKRTGDIDHVIARTAGAKRAYYYRRFEYGYWTPWEQVKLDIEDNPVVPYVWKGRLMLFWLRILKQTPNDPNELPTGADSANSLASLSMGAIKTDIKNSARSNTKVKVLTVLCWSEYYNGKWQPAKTSDIDRPGPLAAYAPTGQNAFERTGLRLYPGETRDGSLIVYIFDVDNNSSYIPTFTYYVLYNTHSLPERALDIKSAAEVQLPDLPDRVRMGRRDDGTFVVGYGTRKSGSTLSRSVLAATDKIRYRTVEPYHVLQNAWTAPLFFDDRRHTFFVTTTEQPVWIREYVDYGFAVGDPVVKDPIKIPPVIIKSDPPKYKPKIPGDEGPIGPDIKNVINPAPIQRFISEDAYIRTALGTIGDVTFGDRRIGPAGALPARVER